MRRIRETVTFIIDMLAITAAGLIDIMMGRDWPPRDWP